MEARRTGDEKRMERMQTRMLMVGVCALTTHMEEKCELGAKEKAVL
jgi:hypothetical protein